jgi:hypothetical protein
VGSFEIVENKRLVSCQLSLLDSLRRMQDVFHVHVLGHYISDPTYAIEMSSLQVSDEGALMSKGICIMDHCIRQLWCRTVYQVNF